MSKFKFEIDEKSLFFGIYNDYSKGQTATVSTPINQSKDENKWHKDILQLVGTGLESNNVPPTLVDKCLNKTTSQANSELVCLFEFKNILLDGIKLNTNCSFGLYIKREIDKIITNKKRKSVMNTHFGRMKLHYPISLLFKSDGFNIDNTSVLNSIITQNGGFAFVVRGFECDVEEKSINFITSIIGLQGIFLSNVFKIKKGVGKKLLIDEIDLEAQDISVDSMTLISNKKSTSINNIDFDSLSKVKVENGILGEQYVYKNISKLICSYAKDILHTSKYYPTSPYDIEYMANGIKKYVEVKATSGTKEVFNMSSGELKFMKKYKENYTLILVTEVTSKFPKSKKFDCDSILKMRQEFPSIRFFPN